MNPKLKELFAEFSKKCKKEGFEPIINILIKPEIADSVSLRERKIVEIVASNYLMADLIFNPLKNEKKATTKKD